MENFDEEKKGTVGLGLIALIVSIIGAILMAITVVQFIKGHFFFISLSRVYLSIGCAVLASVLGWVVEHFEHADERWGSIAKSISGWVIAAALGMFIYVKFL